MEKMCEQLQVMRRRKSALFSFPGAGKSYRKEQCNIKNVFLVVLKVSTVTKCIRGVLFSRQCQKTKLFFSGCFPEKNVTISIFQCIYEVSYAIVFNCGFALDTY